MPSREKGGESVKKKINLVLEVDIDDEAFLDDGFVRDDLSGVIKYCTNPYRITDLKSEVVKQFIKPCPFCGGKAKLHNEKMSDGQCSYKAYYIECYNCHIKTPAIANDGYHGVRCSEEDIKKIWNRRAPE